MTNMVNNVMQNPNKLGINSPLRDAQGHLLKGGGSLNPKGRPPIADSWRAIFEDALNAKNISTTYTVSELNATTGKYEDVKKTIRINAGKTKDIKTLITHKVIDMASKGDMRAIEDLQDRLRGKASQSVDLTSGGDKIHTDPVNIIVSSETAKLMEAKKQ